MKLWEDMIKPIAVLGCICLVSSALLGYTNDITQPIIAENNARLSNEMRVSLLPAANHFVALETTAEGVSAFYAAENGAGYVATAAAKGYGGDVGVMVAFDADGNVLQVKFLDNNETPGLGQKVKNDAFQNQFKGLPPEAFGMHDIDAITGATVSSSAAVSAVNAAIAAYNETVKGGA